MNETERKEVMRDKDIVISPYTPIRFNLGTADDAQLMNQHLDTYGYAVIADVADASQIAKAKDLFWEYLEQPRVAPGMDIKRNDCRTWEHWIGNAATGIIGSPFFNHSKFSWHSRLLPKVRTAFEHVWNSENLIVSFDAGNAFRPWKINPSWVTERNWWHVDQNCLKGITRQGKQCVQGLVTYYDVTEDSGGFCLVPESHLLHDAICHRSPSAQNMQDYVYLESDDSVLRSNTAILPLAQAGDLIIWDSRTVHCNTPGLQAPSCISSGEAAEVTAMEAELLRMVSYVCMVPKTFASPSVLSHKKRGFLSMTPTSHWPTEDIHVYCHSEEKFRDMRECPEEMLRLSGFSEREIRLRQLQSDSLCIVS